MTRRILREQRGAVLMTALMFMVLVVPIVTTALRLSTTLSVDSRSKTDIVKDQYSSIGGYEYALHRLVYEAGYANGLPVGAPDSFTLQLTDETADITVTRVAQPASGGIDILDFLANLDTQVVVNPSTALPGVSTLFTYAVTVTNGNAWPFPLWRITHTLPPGFSYVSGSTTGVTASNPSVTGQTLVWDVSGLGLDIPAQGSLALTFDATATVATGTYCSEAWLDPGYRLTSSGFAPSAKVTVGIPANPWCAGPAVQISLAVAPQTVPSNTSATFGFTLTIENAGSVPLNISRIQDVLPAGFRYVAETTGGSFTTANPSTFTFFGIQWLTWNFLPKKVLASGAVGTLTFQATATVSKGTYTSLVWVTMDEFASSYFSWPTAPVRAMDVFHITSADGGSRVDAEVWLGDESHDVPLWHLKR